MAATASVQSVGAINLCGSGSRVGKFSSRCTSKGFAVDVRLFRKGICGSSQCKLCVAQGSICHALVMDQCSSTSDSTAGNNEKTSTESSLILIRHGESLWNEKNLFTGCVDVPLTMRGIEEAIKAGMRICNIPVDMIYTSKLIRAQMTAMLAMTQHRHKKIFSSKKSGRGSDDDVFKSDGDGASVDAGKKLESRRKSFMEAAPMMRKSFSDRETSPGIEGLNLSNFEQSMVPSNEIQRFRIFVATWNVGGKSPSNNLNLEDFLQVEECADIYICGFQEIVPLSAGNVLVIEDNEPAAKWLALINQALNRPQNESIYSSSDSGPGSRQPSSNNSKEVKSPGSLNFFQKPSLKVLSKTYRADSTLLKACNCPLDMTMEKQRVRKLSDPSKIDSKSLQPQRNASVEDLFLDAEDNYSNSPAKQMSYRLISSKKMVGIFLTIWARKDLVPYIAHLRVSSVGRGIMGYLGNKGCISISMSLHKTSFCFVCSHLASGEKEGDELKRNADVVEILKSTQFPKICKNPDSRAPEKIVDHDRVIWLGDLNYRVALSYEETRLLLEDNDWDALLEKDQLNMEREAGRIFSGFKEGKIFFAPTYKYSHNSDCYAGETVKSKKKRRTPAWCDRILWHGNGIEQLSYIRGESRFSDHRPVCAVFSVEVEKEATRNQINNRFMRKFSCANRRLEYDDCIPQRHSFYEY